MLLTKDNAVNLVCPRCKNPLAETGDVLQCGSCGVDWKVENGVPILTESSKWYPKEHMTKEQFEELLGDIDSKGWEEAIKVATGSMRDSKGFNILAFNESRRDLSSILPLNKESVVLDYGCGMGGISFNLAKSCGHIIAADQSAFRAQFIRARCKNSGVPNVTPVCAGNSRYLPFSDNSFDAVIMNGVLEWMPLSMEGDPRDIQMSALKEAGRVLKKGGIIYLAIENRFGYRYLFFGKGDSHNQKKKKIRYITLLPRVIANLYSKLRIKAPYRCYLYSYGGYRKMLIDSGFRKCVFYFPYPDHNHLKYIIPVDNRKASSSFLNYILNGASLSAKERSAISFLSFTGLLKHFAQDYLIIATR
ncbi:MAG: methyltransferase domain-containing protein [Candidatus Omnitrophica bacterium]|nr:methyltransferase domain-containing protein [Candidatus Omnitrophota bacterium]